MMTLQLDVPITRRQSLHIVVDEHDQVLFTAQRSGAAIAWLWENGHHSFRLVSDPKDGPASAFFMEFGALHSDQPGPI